MQKNPTGAKIMDQLLEGGYETDAVTTVYGPAGSGKTNLATIAALNIAKQGKRSKTLRSFCEEEQKEKEAIEN